MSCVDWVEAFILLRDVSSELLSSRTSFQLGDEVLDTSEP